jgi:hypothetical protein
LKPRRSAQRISMRSTISAQSWASVPPAPALTVTSASPASYSPVNSAPPRAGRARLDERELLLELVGDLSSSSASSLERLEVVDVALEPLVASRACARARVLGRDLRRALLVVPEARRLHLLSSAASALAQRSGVKGSHASSELPRSR